MRSSPTVLLSSKLSSKQQGAALLILLTILILGSVYVLIGKLSSMSSGLLQNQQTTDALAQAKDALVGYALTYYEKNPGQPQGYLPCPDTTGNGSSNPPCGNNGESVIGRLPWRNLGLQPLRDGAGECLWYVVSGGYKNNPKIPLSSDTDGQLLVRDILGGTAIGNTSLNRAIALIFSPGAILFPQDRSFTNGTQNECGSDTPADAINQVQNYLDVFVDPVLNININNASGFDANAGAGTDGSDPLASILPSVFINSPKVYALDADDVVTNDVIFNDSMLAIKPSDFALVYRRMDEWVATRVVRCLEDYQTNNGGKFPFASNLDGAAAPDYNDDALPPALYGRIANEPGLVPPLNDNLPGLGDTLATDPTMNDEWTDEPSPPLPSLQVPANIRCFDEVGPDPIWQWWWWSAWKEMVFIGIDADFVPDGAATLPPVGLSLDGTVQAGAVFVAGRRLVGQLRSNSFEKAQFTNYLEGANAVIADDSFVSGPATNLFNDVVLAVTSVGGTGGGGMGMGMVGGGMGMGMVGGGPGMGNGGIGTGMGMGGM